MVVYYETDKLRKLCTDERVALRTLGKQCARKLMLRITQLRGCDALVDATVLPGAGYHQLHGDREGEIAFALHGGRRMTIVPANEPVPVSEDGGYDLHRITAVRVVFVGDYH